MEQNINKFCVFFDTLSPGLKDSVVSICETAKNKSKIYSDIISLLKITKELYLSNSIPQVDKYIKMLEDIWETSKNNIKTLDTILNLYKEQYPTENINKDLFFSQFFEYCIKDYILYTSQTIFEDYLGGKRRKLKSKKLKKKNKKSKKRYSRKYR
jgi:hypothetical protein